MMARRWRSGRQPCWRDVLHIAVKYGNSCGRNCLTMVTARENKIADYTAMFMKKFGFKNATNVLGNLALLGPNG